MKSITCPKCKEIFKSEFKRDSLGFPEYICPNCQNIIEKPLTTRYRQMYWIIGISAWVSLFFDKNLYLQEDPIDISMYIARIIILILFLTVPFIVLWIDYKKRKFKDYSLNSQGSMNTIILFLYT